MAAHTWIGYEPMFMARDMGFVQHAGVSLVETGSATESLEALATGKVHGAALTLDEVLRARAEGQPLTAVLVFNVSIGADAVLARPGIESLADLRDKRIGAERSALGALVLHMLLDAAGLPRSAVEVVPMTYDHHLEAWHSGEIDALITFEPIVSQLRSEGADVIFDSRQIPDTIFDVLAVHESRLSRVQRSALRELIRGHFEALAHLRRNRDDASFRMAARMGVPARHVLDGMRGLELPNRLANERYLSGRNPRMAQAAATLSDIMVESGLLPEASDLQDLFTAAYLPQHER
ncbi:nitrate ABC transporter substrate-binding protein [Thioalkalivibrio paradoxus ARh 1]|uniref:Nitrate ABC transporter substrate-binding protein n=1 Tax=Thioalkalivibrio paradoxus ARh 1 TaxID=713585 RepID=W0DLW8_9GAMM|nr:nitrate ABC transporter substrate-binding protein [Thioalkalivibrio paradoxus ARh 1]